MNENALKVVSETPFSGYVTTPTEDFWHYEVNTKVRANYTLKAPQGHYIMTSLEPGFSCYYYVVEFLVHHLQQDKIITCAHITRLQIHKSSAITVLFRFNKMSRYPSRLNRLPARLLGFKVHFSFHSPKAMPTRISRGVFNCSVDFYPSFRQHLECNLREECYDGRDEGTEGGCPTCDGFILPNTNKCYFVVKNVPSNSATSGQSCEDSGGRLAVFTKPREIASLRLAGKRITQEASKPCGRHMLLGEFYSGFALGVPNIYRQVWMRDENTVLYDYTPGMLSASRMESYKGDLTCRLLYKTRSSWHRSNKYSNPCPLDIHCHLCESDLSIPIEQRYVNLSMGLLTAQKSKRPGQPIIVCPGSHVTHLFLSCDLRADCGHKQVQYHCRFPKVPTVSSVTGPGRNRGWGSAVSVQMFECSNERAFIHYSLVCDFRPDCGDGSDESFCRHPLCTNFTCNNGQCVLYNKRGDLWSDCFDHSDESEPRASDGKDKGKDKFYSIPTWSIEHQIKLRDGQLSLKQLDGIYTEYEYSSGVVGHPLDPPVVINFNSQGYFTKEQLTNDTCPDTHYRCPGNLTHCLPVYTRCNGYYDCDGREDELDCGIFTCPGHYRCLDSQVCVHTDHLCDGWAQCPQRDDEWLCEEHPCPDGCLCHGLVFVCSQPFSGHLFPQLRWFDGTGSGTSLENVSSNTYLLHLVLAKCQLKTLPSLDLPNLLVLDLRHNLLQTFSTGMLLKLVNLKELVLSHNPLKHIGCYSQGSSADETALRTIDLSFTALRSFSSKPFGALIALEKLNLANTLITHISSDGFRHCSSLHELDLSHSPVSYFPIDVFHSLTKLKRLEAQNYKLCCKAVFPSQLDQLVCNAPTDEVSSCDDLLRTVAYSGFLWLVCFLSVTGNVFCLSFRCFAQRKRTKNVFSLFVISLSSSDLLMGVYIAIVGVADVSLRGKYLAHERDWVTSGACQAAGFLSLLSSEVSALTILLITLDRFIVLSFPFSTVRFNETTASIACLSIWVTGLVLAAVPLLPVTSHWEFYSQTGICIPLPVTRHDFPGKLYSVGVLIVFNFILFLLIAAGQAVIFRSVKKNTMTTDTTKKSQDLTVARRLITIAVSDFLCWFPIGVCGLLALGGVSIPGEVSVAMAIFVLPLNAALNPFLYTANVVLEKRRKALEEKLLNELKLSMITQG